MVHGRAYLADALALDENFAGLEEGSGIEFAKGGAAWSTMGAAGGCWAVGGKRQGRSAEGRLRLRNRKKRHG